jgi:nickel transport protein
MRHLFLLLLLLACALPANAHRVNIFCWVEGNTVHSESSFSSGRPVINGTVRVLAEESGTLLLQGTTNTDGEFSFRIPAQAVAGKRDMEVVIQAGMGHRGSWTVRADEYLPDTPPAAPAVTAGKTDSLSATPPSSTPPSCSPDHPEPKGPGVPAISRAELQTLLDTTLDRKLSPIHKTLAAMQTPTPSLQDIIAGLGYIMGLLGIALYFKSKRN